MGLDVIMGYVVAGIGGLLTLGMIVWFLWCLYDLLESAKEDRR